MAPNPEEQARAKIDELLRAAGWHVCAVKDLNLSAHRGIAVREFPLPGHGFADYLLYIEGKAVGVVEAKKVGATLIGVEIQSDKYTKGLPESLPAWERPLQSTDAIAAIIVEAEAAQLEIDDGSGIDGKAG